MIAQQVAGGPQPGVGTSAPVAGSAGFALELPALAGSGTAAGVWAPHAMPSDGRQASTAQAAGSVAATATTPLSATRPTDRPMVADSSTHPLSVLTPGSDTAAPTSAAMLQPAATPVLAAQDPPPASPAAPAAPATPTPVATAQVEPAIISLATRTDGSNELTVSLNPRDLGQVEIRLVRESNGTTAVTVTATEPGTLQELSQNAHHLHAALDAANIPADGRILNFVPASSDLDRSRNDAPSLGVSAAQDRGGSALGSQNQGQNSGQGQAHGQAWQQGRQARGGQGHDDDYTSSAPIASRRVWQLGGLNITA